MDLPVLLNWVIDFNRTHRLTCLRTRQREHLWMQKELLGGGGTQTTPEATGSWSTGQNNGFIPFLEPATQLIDLGTVMDVRGLQFAVKFTPIVHTSVDAAI
jgi:hypothetical protein